MSLSEKNSCVTSNRSLVGRRCGRFGTWLPQGSYRRSYSMEAQVVVRLWRLLSLQQGTCSTTPDYTLWAHAPRIQRWKTLSLWISSVFGLTTLFPTSPRIALLLFGCPMVLNSHFVRLLEG